jgi:hypothetical protein
MAVTKTIAPTTCRRNSDDVWTKENNKEKKLHSKRKRRKSHVEYSKTQPSDSK